MFGRTGAPHTLGGPTHVPKKILWRQSCLLVKIRKMSKNKLVGKYALPYTKIGIETV